MPPRPPAPLNLRPEPRPGYIAVGWVRGPHGLRGELKITVLSDNPDRFQPGVAVWLAGERRTVTALRPHGDALLIQLDGVRTRDDTEAFRNLLLEVPEEELAALGDGEYYRFEVMGMDVVDGEGNSLGRIEQVLETGANDVYVVESEEGELLVPAIDSVVKQVDVEGRRMVVELLEGLERRPRKEPRRRS